MTEHTIRSMAKELAGTFYDDQARGEKFRRTFPTLKAYMRGQWHQPDGSIVINKPGWMYHIDLARKMLGTMLSMPNVSEIMKERIYSALVDEHERATSSSAKKVLQRKDHQPLH